MAMDRLIERPMERDGCGARWMNRWRVGYRAEWIDVEMDGI